MKNDRTVMCTVMRGVRLRATCEIDKNEKKNKNKAGDISCYYAGARHVHKLFTIRAIYIITIIINRNSNNNRINAFHNIFVSGVLLLLQYNFVYIYIYINAQLRCPSPGRVV